MYDEKERQTRKKRIDPRLRAAGWGIEPHTAGLPLSAYEGVAVEEYPTENGPADYALVAEVLQ